MTKWNKILALDVCLVSGKLLPGTGDETEENVRLNKYHTWQPQRGTTGAIGRKEIYNSDVGIASGHCRLLCSGSIVSFSLTMAQRCYFRHWLRNSRNRNPQTNSIYNPLRSGGQFICARPFIDFFYFISLSYLGKSQSLAGSGRNYKYFKTVWTVQVIAWISLNFLCCMRYSFIRCFWLYIYQYNCLAVYICIYILNLATLTHPVPRGDSSPLRGAIHQSLRIILNSDS